MKGTLDFSTKKESLKMYHDLLKKPNFYLLLVRIDAELAEAIHLAGCAYCGGPLHQSNYPRSPLGLPVFCREYFEIRFSLCCGKCRKRTTPPSVRFFGRYRFPAAIMLLFSAFMSRGSRKRYHQIKRYFGINISLRTWRRWHRWWKDCFTETAFWKKNKALLEIGDSIGWLPRNLLMIYQGRLSHRLTMSLRFLAPLTAGAFRAV
jgi:hypothetical protein